MTNSMTGFGSSRYSEKEIEIYCEIKTVNHRFLEVSTKPNDLNNQLDVFVRNSLSKKLQRGSVDVRFRLNFPSTNYYSVNKASLKNLMDSIKDIPNINTDNINFSDIKDMPGIVQSENKISIDQKLIKKVFIESLNQLLSSRLSEGSKIKKIFLSKISNIEKSTSKLSKLNKDLTKKRSDNLRRKIQNLTKSLDSSRLEQEVAILVLKHDVAEEIERINFHSVSLRKELSSSKSSGKKIDFILQELFRETSTLSVKLDEPKYKQIALDMKLSVEEMREQAQNIE
ncbi:MAG: hypothetical protein ACI9SS_000578 [Gammaproteobacteria bacterium]|jgi:uncharacterized protein (TIGR00255 family)|tara:strand:+ start:735 stop:1586 length:852 start_codon:yes stop_codon:yes gene_type:complete